MKRQNLVKLDYHEELIIELPDGKEVNLIYNSGDLVPELDIIIPNDSCVNCFREGLIPSEPTVGDTQNVLRAKQVIICME